MKKKSYKTVVWAIVWLLLLTAAIIIIGGIVTACGGTTSTTMQPISTHTPTTTTSTSNETTWKMVVGNYANYRWFGDGIAVIKNAKTKADAVNAANVWLDKVKRDPNLLIGAARYFFPKEKYTKRSLVKNGWASDSAVQLVGELQLALGQSKIAPSLAPADGTNSGVDSGNVVAAVSPGITGNRKAIQVTLANGKKIWVMARCGNLVTTGHAPVPPGKTELQPKNWKKDPYARGNATVGGGQNQDPGPGKPTKKPKKP